VLDPRTYLGTVNTRTRRGRVRLAVGAALLLGLGCAHSSQPGSNHDASSPVPRVTPKTPQGHPPLAASASELIDASSQQKIARALKAKGVVERDDLRGEQLSSGLRKFQESQGLAATGFADHETLLRLGIDPREVDSSLEDVSKPSDEAGRGGSGAESSGKKGSTGHQTPPSDEAGKGASKPSEPGNGGG